MSHAPATARAPSPWIISPAWDLAYIVATPLAIVPLVLWLERAVFTPTQILLFVTSFATLAHHLPGFMRAYGDRELFARFRWRFLLVPPLVFATAVAFLPPPSLVARLGLPWVSFDGLELALLLWGTWHGLMQTFGFMRIYDLKRGAGDAWTARLDFWLCALLFVAGFAFSDARVFGLMNVAWRSGVPIVGPEWLVAARYLIGAATVVVFLLYIADIVRQSRRERGVSWIKIALAASTAALYWFSGRLSTNLVIGIAMFEIFHAVQYYAIVWTYNRRLAERVGERFGLLGFLFRERWSMLGLYLAMIAAYGSIRYFSGAPDDADLIARHADWIALITAAFNTSTLLHFYYDGFIWKVSDRKTAANLDVSDESSLADRFVPGAIHAAKWAAFYAALGLLVWLQWRQMQATHASGQNDDQRVYAALARWTPDLPEAQLQAAQLAIESGDFDRALKLARSAVALRPRSHEAYATLGDAQLHAREPAAAAESFRRAIALAADRWRYRAKLAEALRDAGELDAALDVLREARQGFPDEPKVVAELVAMLNLRAETAYRAGDVGGARHYYQELLVVAPEHDGARFRLGQFEYEAGNYQSAAAAFRRLADADPKEPKARMMLGVVLMKLGRLKDAEASLRQALALAPQDADVHYNLAMFLHLTGRKEEAQGHFDESIRRKGTILDYGADQIPFSD